MRIPFVVELPAVRVKALNVLSRRYPNEISSANGLFVYAHFTSKSKCYT